MSLGFFGSASESKQTSSQTTTQAENTYGTVNQVPGSGILANMSGAGTVGATGKSNVVVTGHGQNVKAGSKSIVMGERSSAYNIGNLGAGASVILNTGATPEQLANLAAPFEAMLDTVENLTKTNPAQIALATPEAGQVGAQKVASDKQTWTVGIIVAAVAIVAYLFIGGKSEPKNKVYV